MDGRDEEFRELFDREFAPLVRALHAYCGSAEVAADVVQGAFERAWRRWDRVRALDAPGAWIRRVALNAAKNHHRSQARGRRAATRLGAPEDPWRWADAEAGAEHAELRRAVAALPDGQRLAVALHYLADLPVATVAEAAQVSPGTVKSQLHDARRNLARAIGARNG